MSDFAIALDVLEPLAYEFDEAGLGTVGLHHWGGAPDESLFYVGPDHSRFVASIAILLAEVLESVGESLGVDAAAAIAGELWDGSKTSDDGSGWLVIDLPHVLVL